MAWVALTSLLETIKLEHFLQRIPTVSIDNRREMVSLRSNLYPLQDFLEKPNNGGFAIRDLETKIRDFALEAEDEIEIQLSNFLLSKHTEHQDEASQKLQQTLREAAENAEELLKIINDRSSFIDESYETHNFQYSENVKSLKFEDRMIGHRRDYEMIKRLLYEEMRMIIVIVGMAGIGKTTLARRVFEDESVASNFKVRGWITMPQEYNESQMLCFLLQSIKPAERNEIKIGSTPDELAQQIYKCLEGRRYLIVLDNVTRNVQARDYIRKCFPSYGKGGCILLTTRHSYPPYYYDAFEYVHRMPLLDPKESWDLFCNILSFKECMASEFEKIKSRVVEICEGLPHTIVNVAKRLSKRNNIQQEWKTIEKELESLGALGHSALSHSYNQLPQHLKACLLYLAVFPKCKEIRVKMLIRLWIAEGFLKPSEHEELESQAYRCLQELIDRSLVLIGNQSSDGKIKTCRMHSALHSFCVLEAQKEGIFCAVNTSQLPRWSLNMFANSCRWLSLYAHSFDYYVLFRTNNPRSIFFFKENTETFVPLKLLRVLAFVPPPFFQRVPMHLGDLVFLRYLSVTQWFEGLDYIVSANLNLQTLVVSGCEAQRGAQPLHLPSRIWTSPQLRHLQLGNMYMVDPPRVVKENLQTLSWVSPTPCRKEVYYNFPNIKSLKIFHKHDIQASQTCGSCSNPIILNDLDNLLRLEMLTISVSGGCTLTFPRWSMFALQLKQLRLIGTNISESDLTIIASMDQLEVLKLENAFYGKVWEVANGGFNSLRFLLLEAKILEQLMANNYSFPKLERLVLRSCYCLKEIPSRFADIFTFRSIELEQCCASVIASAKQIRLRHKFRSKIFEIKIQGPEYDESENTQRMPPEDDMAPFGRTVRLEQFKK